MNNIITNWQNILEESKSLGMPSDKKRGILREYLQTLILSEVYSQKVSKKLTMMNIDVEFSFKIIQSGIGHGSIKFPALLKDIGISTDPREKVRIDLDFTTPNK